MKKSPSSSAPDRMQVFLWIAFLPAAWFGALLSASMIQYSVPPPGQFSAGDGTLLRLIAAQAAWGTVFVWLGTRIAPQQKILVAIALAGFSLLYLGLAAGRFIKTHQWPEVMAALTGIICAVACARHQIRNLLDPGDADQDNGEAPSLQKTAPLTPQVSVVKIPAPKAPVETSAGKRRKKVASTSKKPGLCCCPQSLPVTKYRHWPGTKDSVPVLFCQHCDRPIEETWAVEPAYSIAQSKLRPPYKL